MDETRHETKNAVWRKKIKKISLLNTTTETLWKPPLGVKYMVLFAAMIIRNHAGTNSDEPNILIDNGTDGNNIVAGVDSASHTVGAVQRLAVVGNFEFDNDHPLRLKKPDAANGSTVYDVDIVILAVEISEIQS